MDESLQGKPPKHPVALAIRDAIHDPLVRGALVEDHFLRVIQARVSAHLTLRAAFERAQLNSSPHARTHVGRRPLGAINASHSRHARNLRRSNLFPPSLPLSQPPQPLRSSTRRALQPHRQGLRPCIEFTCSAVPREPASVRDSRWRTTIEPAEGICCRARSRGGRSV